MPRTFTPEQKEAARARMAKLWQDRREEMLEKSKAGRTAAKARQPLDAPSMIPPASWPYTPENVDRPLRLASETEPNTKQGFLVQCNACGTGRRFYRADEAATWVCDHTGVS
jgi:hypothetical protein